MTPAEFRALAATVASGVTEGYRVTEHDTDIDQLIITVMHGPDVWTRHEMHRAEFFQWLGLVSQLAGLDDTDDEEDDEGEAVDTDE